MARDREGLICGAFVVEGFADAVLRLLLVIRSEPALSIRGGFRFNLTLSRSCVDLLDLHPDLQLKHQLDIRL